MNTHQQLAIQALESMKGDNTYRARAAFRGMNETEMEKQYGESGKTRREILEDYEAHDRKVDAAIAWVRAAS